MNLMEAKDSSTVELMHASTGFWTEVLSMARRVINVIRSCAFACLLTIAVLVHGAASAELRSGTLELDPSKTLIEFRLPGALHTTHGTFKLERGTIIADPATGKAGGSIVVDARSGDTGIGARDNEMRESVLEVQKYPEITFTPQQVTGQLGTDGQFQARLQGVLTLHGAGHQIVIEVQGRLIGDGLIATSHFSVPYVDWGLEDPSVLFLTVAKQVDIEIATAGHVVWTRPAN
ncbi:YceI family protein [Candidatus Binatus sp.]|jgi:polyisoprenoid-binding protein YceI|uniref:YceI family protein n=1 Tax=Candidatus Binatus sp. TaxID=2811406 RepID=UPI003D0A6D43